MAQFTMQDILKYIQIELEEYTPGQFRGKCPFHESDDNGKHTSFHLNFDRGFHCFRCGASGGPITFIKDYFKLERYWDAHKYIFNNFHIKTDRFESWEKMLLEPYENYLRKRGISEETAQHFNLSACLYGRYKDRIKIPVIFNNEEVGSAYRAIKDMEPRYLFNKGFKRSEYLYNFDSVSKNDKKILLVEGFFSVFKLHEYGVKAIASMSCNVSDRQYEMLFEKRLPVYVMFDGDEAGIRAAEKVQKALHDKLETRIIQLPSGRQPDELSKRELESIIKKYGI